MKQLEKGISGLRAKEGLPVCGDPGFETSATDHILPLLKGPLTASDSFGSLIVHHLQALPSPSTVTPVSQRG